MPVQPFSFWIAAHRAADGHAWRELARRTEDLGYCTLALPDHRGNQFAPIPALAAAASVTTTLRVATLVLGAAVRHPVLAAEELATLDVLSDGRLDWGMGAGWLPEDVRLLDAELASPDQRVSDLIDAVERMKTHFDDAQRSATLLATIQRPHPPLVIGGSKERLVRYAAGAASTVHLSPLPASRQYGPYAPSMSVSKAIELQLGWVHTSAAAATNEPTIAVTALPAKITADGDGAVEKIAGPTGLTPDEVRRSPHVLVGSVDHICDTIEARRERWGISCWVIPDGSLESFAPVVERLAGR